MTWFKVDDGLAFHPKAIAAGNAALGLWVRAGAWCSSNLTDGALPRHMIGTLGAQVRDARRLVQAGLWCETDDGYQFTDWQDWQPSKAQVTAERETTKKRQARWREQQRNGVTDAVSDAVSNGVRTPAPSRPVPSLGGLGSQSPNGRSTRATSGPDLDKIAEELQQSRAWADRVANDVLSRAGTTADPTAYILAAIRGEPKRYQPTNGPPPINRLCDHSRDRLTCHECAREQT